MRQTEHCSLATPGGGHATVSNFGTHLKQHLTKWRRFRLKVRAVPWQVGGGAAKFEVIETKVVSQDDLPSGSIRRPGEWFKVTDSLSVSAAYV